MKTALGASMLQCAAFAALLAHACGGAKAEDDGVGGDGGVAHEAGADQSSEDGAAEADATPDALPDSPASDGGDASDANAQDSPAPTPCLAESIEFGPWTFDHTFAADATRVYFTVSSGTQTILKAWPKAGGPLAEPAIFDAPVSALAANAQAVFVLTRGSASEDGTLYAYPLPAGPTAVVASAPGPLESLALAATDAYVSRRSDGGAVLRVPLTGGSFTPLATGVSQPWQLALAAGSVLWLSYDNDSALWTLPKSGGAASKLLSGVGRYAVDDSNIYYSQQNYLRVLPLTGGTPWTLASEMPYRIFVDQDTLYLKDECSVRKIAKSGGPEVPVAGADPCNAGDDSFAVDDACVYFMHGSATPGSDGGYVWTGHLDRFPK